MTDEIAKLLEELNKTANKKLIKRITIDPGYGGEEPPRHANCPCTLELSDDLIQKIAERIFKGQWSWPVCKAAFPHDIDAAMRFYREIHGEDPPHLAM